jgi:signal peptidase I
MNSKKTNLIKSRCQKKQTSLSHLAVRLAQYSNDIYGISMYPTIITRSSQHVSVFDTVVLSRWIYQSKNPRRGDIVGFTSGNDSRVWIKRIVGLPGETVEFQHPYVFINGEKLLDPPIFMEISSREREYDDYDDANEMDLRRITLPITLGSDEYLLFGDNTSMSWNRRMYGPVSRNEIVGKVTRIIFPPWRIRELTTGE